MQQLQQQPRSDIQTVPDLHRATEKTATNNRRVHYPDPHATSHHVADRLPTPTAHNSENVPVCTRSVTLQVRHHRRTTEGDERSSAKSSHNSEPTHADATSNARSPRTPTAISHAADAICIPNATTVDDIPVPSTSTSALSNEHNATTSEAAKACRAESATVPRQIPGTRPIYNTNNDNQNPPWTEEQEPSPHADEHAQLAHRKISNRCSIDVAADNNCRRPED